MVEGRRKQGGKRVKAVQISKRIWRAGLTINLRSLAFTGITT